MALRRLQSARIFSANARAALPLPETRVRECHAAACCGRQRIRTDHKGLRDPRSIIQGRNTLFAMFGGRVALRPAFTKVGVKPYLIARVGVKREVLLQSRKW
jgi:hypothetical protein